MFRVTDDVRMRSRGSSVAELLRMVLLLAYREGVEAIHIASDGNRGSMEFQCDGQTCEMVPPPAHAVEDIAAVLLGAESLRNRLKRWWSGSVRGGVPCSLTGTIEVQVGSLTTTAGYDLLWHPGGVWVGLSLRPSPQLAVEAVRVAEAYARTGPVFRLPPGTIDI